MLSLKCVVCGNKKLRFIKEQEVKGSYLLGNLLFLLLALLEPIHKKQSVIILNKHE